MTHSKGNWFLTDRFGKEYIFDNKRLVIGRKSCDINLKSVSVNYRHCIISVHEKDNSLRIKDLGTFNGTFVNDQQLKADTNRILKVNDVIRLAYDQVTFTVHLKNCTNIISLNSPYKSSEPPSYLTEPEKSMEPVICELNDSVIDLNSSSNSVSEVRVMTPIEAITESPDRVTTVVMDSTDDSQSSCFNIPKSIQTESNEIEDNTSLNSNDIGTMSRPAESFTIDFSMFAPIGDVDKNDSSCLKSFVPSKLRESMENREKSKRTKVQQQSTISNKNIKQTSDQSKFGIKERNSPLPKPSSKLIKSVKSRSNSKTDENLIPKSKKKVEKSVSIKSDIPPKVTEKQPKSNPTKFIKNSQKTIKEPSVNSPTVSRKNSKSYVLSKMLTGNETTNNSLKCDSVQNTISISEKTENRSSPIVDHVKGLQKNRIDLVDISLTTSRKNTKSYLLTKMLVGDDLLYDFTNYEHAQNSSVQQKFTDKDCRLVDKANNFLPQTDTHDSIDNVSECGTYVIENPPEDVLNDVDDQKTIDKDDCSTISDVHIYNDIVDEIESKSSTKWMSDFPNDDSFIDSDNKSRKGINSKFSISGVSQIPPDKLPSSVDQCGYLSENVMKSNLVCPVTDSRTRNAPLSGLKSDNNNNFSKDMQPQGKIWLANAVTFDSCEKMDKGDSSAPVVVEDFYVPEESVKSTVPVNDYALVSHFGKKVKEDSISSLNINLNTYNQSNHPKSTFSIASLDTALLLQDTEALLNDMEKRVYSRKDVRQVDVANKDQASFSHNSEKIPYVDDNDDKEDDINLHNLSNGVEDGTRFLSKKHQSSLSNASDSSHLEELNRSYNVRSPISASGIRRNNSCKVGVSETPFSQTGIGSRKLNANIRNQRSCSMIEEQKFFQNVNNNNVTNFDVNLDYRNKPKPSVLAMNSGILFNRRGSAGYSSVLNSPITKLELGSIFNTGLNQKSKEPFPYISSNLLSLHRQRFNRYEYGQHSLKMNSNSTTMLYQKLNNISPPWNGDDNVISPKSAYPIYDTDYYSYNTMPESFETALLLSKAGSNIIGNSHPQLLNVDCYNESEFHRRDDGSEYNQHGNVSGRSSAFSPVNSLHQSTESIANFQTASKSRSSLGINEQRHCNYDLLLVSSLHQYSARLCRYAEEIVHRLRREDPNHQSISPVEVEGDHSDTFGKWNLANKELQESLCNMRSLEKLLQKVEKSVFPPEKSGRNSTIGSCSEDTYLNQLERINKELKDFVPIDHHHVAKSSNTKQQSQTDYSSGDANNNNKAISVSQNSKEKSKTKSDANLKQPKTTYSTSETNSTSKTKYYSLSKRFQHRKD